MSTLESFRAGLRLMRTINPQIRASQIEMLITVQLSPGISQTDLAVECDLTLSAVSRAVDVFSTSGRRDGRSSALGLLEARKVPDNERLLALYLTPKGQQILKLLSEINHGN